jgi:group I intron endonuclease
VYKITNIENGMYYIGAHQTNDKCDDYMGSGNRIKNAIAKYGKSKFTKEILYEASSKEEMYLKEKELVVVDRKNTYNIRSGGYGGFDYINQNGLRANGFLGKKHSEETKKLIAEKSKGNIVWLGRNHREETKKKMSQSHQGKHLGETNSQFGKMWINNGMISAKIMKHETIPVGWCKGRVNGRKKYNL